jgi:hypothetical protein
VASVPKVLYVTAWGRSGTTLVDNILNGYPGVFSAGELHYLWRRGLGDKRSCGCGTPVPRCPIWTEVLRVAFGDDRPNPQWVARLQTQITRTRHTTTLLRGSWSTDEQRYADIMRRLYLAIGKVTGAELIIDSSKHPAEAALLARVPAVEAHLLHMMRDPRAVAHSWSRRKEHVDRKTAMMQHSPARSTVNWLVWNALSERVGERYGERHHRLRYEDLMADPRREIEALLARLGVAAADGPFRGAATVHLEPNHTVSGNPGRFKVGEVDIRTDDAWRRDQGFGPKLTASVLALPKVRRYGYGVWPGRRPRPSTEAADAGRD